MLKKGLLLLVTLTTLMAPLPWNVSANTLTQPAPSLLSSSTLPSWFISSFLPPMGEIPQSGPTGEFHSLNSGLSEPLPIGEGGFMFNISPLSLAAKQAQVRIAPVHTPAVLSLQKENVTFLGLPFQVQFIDTLGRIWENFGVRPIYTEINESIVQIYTPTIEVIIPYNEKIVRTIGCGEEVGLDLYVYDTNDRVWRRMASWVDTQKNELHVWFHTMSGDIFRLGVLDSLPTIVLDPDTNIGRMNDGTHEGTYNVETAQDIRTYIQALGMECSQTITVYLTHEDPQAAVRSESVRAHRIEQLNPDVALVIAYDIPYRDMRYGNGGVKALFVDTGENRSLARDVAQQLHRWYPYYHGGNSLGLYPYDSAEDCYHMGASCMGTSVETEVALHSPDIPIARVEVGLLSLYQNRDQIEEDRRLPRDQRQIPQHIGVAILRDFLGIKLGCLLCEHSKEYRVYNKNYNVNKQSQCLIRLLMQPETVQDSAIYNIHWLDEDITLCDLRVGTIVSSNPPIPIFMEVGKTGEPTKIVIPTNYAIGAIALEMIGAITKVTFSDYEAYSQSITGDIPPGTAEVISAAANIGLCNGLVTWIAKHCAGQAPLAHYGASGMEGITVTNDLFMQEVLWYQVVQLTRQFSDSINTLTPLEMYNLLQAGGTRDPSLPRIALLIPDTDTVQCEDGEMPIGHTLFIVGSIESQGTPYLIALDPNDPSAWIQLEIDEIRNQWIYRSPPYPASDGSYVWRGSVIYAIAPGDVPPYPYWGELNVDFIDVNELLVYDGTRRWLATGLRRWLMTGGMKVKSNGCATLPRAEGGNVPFSIAGLRRYPDVPRQISIEGTLHGSNVVAETLMSDKGMISFISEATTETINTLGLYTDTYGLTVTTNMASQHLGLTLYRSVNNDSTNRIFNVRHTTIHQGEILELYASPHNNIFTFNNSQGESRNIDILLVTVGRPGLTVFFTHSFTIQAGHTVSFTAWNWDNLSDTLIFAYDSDGITVIPILLQDVVRPTHIVFGKPSYVSETITYLTPQTKVSFDVIPATCGISATLYRIDEGEFQVYTQAFTLEGLSEGSHIIEYYSIDNAGNVEPLNQANLYLYNEPPLVSIVLSGEIDSTGWYTPPVTITLLTTPTVLPLGETSCQLRPNGTTFLYTGPFTVGNETSEVRCTVWDLAGLKSTARTGIPIRKAQEDLFETGLGDPTLEESQRTSSYRTIFSRSYERPGTVIQTLEAGLCNNVPLQMGDFRLLPDPPLGVPAEATRNCPVASRALYGSPIAIFIPGITDTKTMWEAPMFLHFLKEELNIPAEQLIILNESDLQAGKLNENSNALLIIPAIEESFVPSITARLGITGLQALRQFAANGGHFYASGGYAAMILAEAGIISASAITTQSLIAENNLAQVYSLQPDSPLFFNWITTTVYVPNGDLVLTPTGNLTALARYSGTNAQGSPAILYGRYGRGELVIANHHPLGPHDPIWYPFVINVLFNAMDAPLSLLIQAEQQINTDIPYDLLPAYEKDIPIQLTIATDYLSLLTGTLQGLTVTLNPGFYFSPTENTIWDISEDGQVATLNFITSTSILTQGQRIFTLIARTASTQTLNPGIVVVGHAEATLQAEGKNFKVTSEAPTVRSTSPPNLFRYLRSSPEVIYGIEQDDTRTIEAIVGIVNMHDGPAYQNVYTSVIPLLAPILDLKMRDVVTDANGDTVWIMLSPIFDVAPYPEKVWPDQHFSLRDWDGQTVITLTLPADSPIEMPLSLVGNGCDRIDGKPCCANGSGNVQVGIVRTPTQTLVILPAMRFTWNLGDINGYEYQDPNIRYHIQIKERHGRAIRFLANYDPREPSIYEDTTSVYLHNHGAIWLNAGQAPLALDGQVIKNPPQYAGKVGGEAFDLWGRGHFNEAWAKQLFFIIPGNPPDADGASVLDISASAEGDTNGDGIPETLTETIPADRPVTICLHTTIHDYGRQMTQTASLLLRIPVGLGYQITPVGGDWASASASAHGYAIYSATHIIDGDYNVLYRVTLPNMAEEAITTCLVVQPYPGIHHEGYRPYLNGAFYFYPNDTGPDWPFNLEVSFAQAAWAVQHDIQINPTLVPWRLGHGENTFYYALPILDLYEPQQVAPPTHIATSMYGDAIATTYVGGSTTDHEILDTQLIDIDDVVLIRVEIHNNTGITWTNLTITAAYPGLIIEPYHPTEGKMALSEHSHLQLQHLHGYGWGVYYYLVRLDPTVPISKGIIHEVPFTLTGDHVPQGFTIPPARIGIPKAGQQEVTTILGKAIGAQIVINPGHDAIHIEEARITTLSHYEEWRTANITTQAQLYSTWPTVTFHTITASQKITIDLPPLSNTIPSNGEVYVIVLKEKAGPFAPDVHRLEIDQAPTVVFTNAFHVQQVQAAPPVWMDIHGPKLVAIYHNLPHDTRVTSFTLSVTVRNEGDRIAIQPSIVFTMPLGITVTAKTSACQPAVPLTTHQAITCAIADLIPGGEDNNVRFTIEGQSGKHLPNLIVAQARGHYINGYTGLPETDFLEVAHIPSHIYLPIIAKEYVPPYVDLIITKIEIQPSPIHVGADPTILITIKNVGTIPIEGPIWIDLQRDHCPEVNQRPEESDPTPWMAWRIDEILQPGESLILSSNDVEEGFKRWTSFDEARTYQLCALVDSYDDPAATDPQGMIHESNEHNNTFSLVVYVTEALTHFSR